MACGGGSTSLERIFHLQRASGCGYCHGRRYLVFFCLLGFMVHFAFYLKVFCPLHFFASRLLSRVRFVLVFFVTLFLTSDFEVGNEAPTYIITGTVTDTPSQTLSQTYPSTKIEQTHTPPTVTPLPKSGRKGGMREGKKERKDDGKMKG